MATTNKPARMEQTVETDKKTVAIAATDSTGKRVHAVESLLGTTATKGALAEAQKKVLEETRKIAKGIDDVKKNKRTAVENVNTGSKLRR